MAWRAAFEERGAADLDAAIPMEPEGWHHRAYGSDHTPYELRLSNGLLEARDASSTAACTVP